MAITAVVWTGMAFFFSEMDQVSKAIFYIVTSWLLLLIVITLKAYIRNKKGDTQ
ncbi:O-antigen ligase [Virgibacillus natechei]|uniref:O-antigen ligase n=1 Tax=Virgibacillus natechei TaxID=1216297 RepID=A0ABS4II67_9BACI|nr:O-antigen ligase [Virgibacillus natechei]